MKNQITKRLIKINSKLRITYLKKSFLMDIILKLRKKINIRINKNLKVF